MLKAITKKIQLLTLLLLSSGLAIQAQERLAAFGYGMTYVGEDSSNFNLTIDLNRIPGASEKGNGYFIVNEVINGSRFGFYSKPTLDVNIGSGVSSAPNNITFGLPIGLAHDFKSDNGNIITPLLEISPEMVSDKSFLTSLLYVSIGPYLTYEYTYTDISVFGAVGINAALGKRAIKDADDHAYRRIGVPVYLKMRFIDFKDDESKKKIHVTTSFKFNSVSKDIKENEDSYTFVSLKLDYFFTQKLGINFTYNNGYEEPLFKQNDAWTLGVVFAR